MADKKQTPLADVIAAFSAGKMSEADFIADLASRTYATPPRAEGDPLGKDGKNWWDDVENTAMLPAAPDTWTMVDHAAARGEIPYDAYMRANEAVARAHGVK